MKCCKIIIGLMLFSSGVYGQIMHESDSTYFIDSLKKAGVDTIITLARCKHYDIVTLYEDYSILWKSHNYIYLKYFNLDDYYYTTKIPAQIIHTYIKDSTIVAYPYLKKNKNPFNYLRENSELLKNKVYVIPHGAKYNYIHVKVYMGDNEFEFDGEESAKKIPGKNVKNFMKLIYAITGFKE